MTKSLTSGSKAEHGDNRPSSRSSTQNDHEGVLWSLQDEVESKVHGQGTSSIQSNDDSEGQPALGSWQERSLISSDVTSTRENSMTVEQHTICPLGNPDSASSSSMLPSLASMFTTWTRSADQLSTHSDRERFSGSATKHAQSIMQPLLNARSPNIQPQSLQFSADDEISEMDHALRHDFGERPSSIHQHLPGGLRHAHGGIASIPGLTFDNSQNQSLGYNELTLDVQSSKQRLKKPLMSPFKTWPSFRTFFGREQPVSNPINSEVHSHTEEDPQHQLVAYPTSVMNTGTGDSAERGLASPEYLQTASLRQSHDALQNILSLASGDIPPVQAPMVTQDAPPSRDPFQRVPGDVQGASLTIPTRRKRHIDDIDSHSTRHFRADNDLAALIAGGQQAKNYNLKPNDAHISESSQTPTTASSNSKRRLLYRHSSADDVPLSPIQPLLLHLGDFEQAYSWTMPPLALQDSDPALDITPRAPSTTLPSDSRVQLDMAVTGLEAGFRAAADYSQHGTVVISLSGRLQTEQLVGSDIPALVHASTQALPASTKEAQPIPSPSEFALDAAHTAGQLTWCSFPVIPFRRLSLEEGGDKGIVLAREHVYNIGHAKELIKHSEVWFLVLFNGEQKPVWIPANHVDKAVLQTAGLADP